jgi:hypothetical protein
LFVAVTVTGAATGPRQLNLGSAELVSNDVRYKSYRLSAVTAAPGFKTSTDTLFEVDPARIDGLTLEMWQTKSSRAISNGYGSHSESPQPTPTSGVLGHATTASRSR